MKGILDVKGINNNPFTNQPYSNVYKNLAESWSKYPAYENANELIKDIKNNNVLTVVSGTGSGKTVLFPKYVAHVFDYKKKIAITFPKKDIAKSSAQFSANCLDVELGTYVGYQYRNCGKNTQNEKTKLLYMTDGTLVARILSDPLLLEFDAVLVDEAHERKINIDFLLYLLRNVLKERKEFKLIIMSATINEEIFKNYFSKFAYKNLFIGAKTNYPIKSEFLDGELDIVKNEYLGKGKDLIQKLLKDKDEKGAIIFFVSSINETKNICELLAFEDKSFKNVNNCVPMFSGMMENAFDYVTGDKEYYEGYIKNGRKIIIATNMAESSVTIPKISYVIDSGVEVASYFDPVNRIKILEKRYITQAQAKQRMGRTGRTGSGTCIHLYTKDIFDNKMEKFPAPSIRKESISYEMMRLLGIPQISNVKILKKTLNEFIEPPNEKYIKYELKYLKHMKMITTNEDDGQLTNLGNTINDLQIEPAYGLMMLMGFRLNCFREISALITIIGTIKGQISNLFTLPLDDDSKDKKWLLEKFEKVKKEFKNDDGDHIAILKMFKEYESLRNDEQKLKDWCYKYFIKKSVFDNSYHEYQRKKNMYKEKLVELKLPPVNEKILNQKIKHKIIVCLLYGLSGNILKIKNKKIKSDLGIQVDKNSFLNITEKKQKIIYTELSKVNKTAIKAQIISRVSNKSIEMFKLIGDL